MYKYSKDGISVLSVLDARRAKKSGLFPVKIQVIHNRRQKYYSTGQELSREDWANLAESKSRRLTEARSNIENSFSIIKGQVEALAERGDFSFDLLSVRLGRCSTATVNAAIKAKTEELKRNGQAGTYRSYHALLTALEDLGMPRIVASSSPRNMIEMNLQTTGTARYFHDVVSGTEVAHSKPAPDTFLLAAQKLRLDPKDCLVLEDSFNGIRAGRAAGCVTVMVPDLMQPTEEITRLYDRKCDDLLQVRDLLIEGKL